MGLKVLAAHDATTALALIRMRSPHVICLDVQMPSDNGQKFCETIASDESLRETPIVILTNGSDPDTVIRCSALCAYYVEKCPEIWNRLEPLLKELLDVPPLPAAADAGPASTTSTGDAPSEGPYSVAASEARCEAVPQPCPAPTPCEEALDKTDVIPSAPDPTAVIQSEAEGSAGPADSRSETERDQAPEAIGIESESAAQTDSLWRQLTQAVGRAMAQTVSPNAADSHGKPASMATEAEVSEDKTAASAPVENPAPSDLFAVRESIAAAERETVPDRESVSPVLAATDERVPCQPTPHEAARLVDLDKAWTNIGRVKAAPPTPIERRDVSMSQKPKEEAVKTILIADDDGDLVQMLALRCTQMGLRMFRSPDAMHALLGAHRIRPDLMVLDVNMPGGNGLSVCEMMAGDETLGKIPVIIMTGDTSEEIPRRCRAFHAEYVPKGAALWERLEPAIRRALGFPAPPPTRAMSSNAASETDPGRRWPKILCIDDDPEISKILKFRLERYGVDVLRAFNGMQGYWTALDMRPDMIILDMVMPDGSGNYIFGRLRSHPLTEKVPVLMLTGVNTPGVRRQMFGLGVDAYLTKPLDFIALLEHIRQYVPLCDTQPTTERREAADSPEGVTTEFLAAGLAHEMAH
jgi:DNA-binding response OmpR family regulator